MQVMIKQLTIEHAQQFCDLIVDMYSHLENLEWFSPMPFDLDNVIGMIQHPRFYIIGYFENNTLCAVSSLDYKCGKLIGKIDLPENCNTDKLVEVGFTMVHSKHRGKGIMKQMVAHLLNKIKQDGFEWCFGKVHKNNFASSKSLLNNGFEVCSDFSKPVKIDDFKWLASQPFFSAIGKENAQKTLAKVNNDATEIIVDYNIIIKKL
jgi:RimJ/RimL family protein N-acetyltransferase